MSSPRIILLGVVALTFASFLTGCTAAPTVAVSVSVGQVIPALHGKYAITIRDKHGTLLAHDTLKQGESERFSLPVAKWYSIQAKGLCVVRTGPSAGNTISARFDGKHCSI